MSSDRGERHASLPEIIVSETRPARALASLVRRSFDAGEWEEIGSGHPHP